MISVGDLTVFASIVLTPALFLAVLLRFFRSNRTRPERPGLIRVILGNALGRRMPFTDIFFGLTVVLVVASGLHYAYQLHQVVTSEEGESKVVAPDE